MKRFQFFSGFSLIELLIVISIIALLSVVALISFSKNKSQVVVDSFVELFDDQVSLLQTSVVTKKLEKVEIRFSLNTPRSYQVLREYFFSDAQNESLAQNLLLSSVQDVSASATGTATLSWDVPQNGNDVSFLVFGDDVELSRQSSAVSPQIVTPLAQYQKYTLQIENSVTSERGADIDIQYFSQENISAEERFPLVLTKIEGENFAHEWISLDDVLLKIIGNSGKVQIVSNENSFLNVRFTFEKQDYSTTYELL